MIPSAAPPTVMAVRSGTTSDDQDDSRTSSSTASPAPNDIEEESDFFLGANDSESSLGVPNIQDMQVEDSCWPPINRLPNEILISVFARLGPTPDLYHCMLVSKRWARNAVDMLWHRPACTNWRNHSSICQTLGSERPFFNYRDFIKRLNLAALADKVSDGSVLPLATCTRIERLTLTNCTNLTDSGLTALVSNSPSLLALDISNDKAITEQSINAIAQNCKRLQGLNISGCEAISGDSMINLARSCKYIKRLKLNECTQLRDDAILAFAHHCPNVLEIDLYHCIHIGNRPVTALLAKGNCLRELRLANCKLIDDGAFLALPENRVYEHLRILDLTSCENLTDVAVQRIIDIAPRLRNLVLAKCRNITDVAVHAIAKLGKNLHFLHLGHCGQLTDEGVKKLVHSCNRIRYIDLGCCTHLTDYSVRKLATLPKLKRIGLVKCSSITDESVIALAESAYRPRVRKDQSGNYVNGVEYLTPSLERVHLSYCVNLSLSSIWRLLNCCPRLTHLSLTGVAAFQRDEFQPFCRVAPPEFTQHQRDVFCVFSGNMVSQFRDFLNSSPMYSLMRETLPFRSYGMLRGAAAAAAAGPTASIPVTNYLNAADDTGLDDEMIDEENDTEVLDGNDMIVDGQAQLPQAAHHHSHNQESAQSIGNTTITPLPMAYDHNLLPISHGLPPPPTLEPQHIPSNLGPLAFSSFLNNQPASGEPPLSANGRAQASVATLSVQMRPQANGQSSASGPADGASTAPMHRQAQGGAEP